MYGLRLLSETIPKVTGKVFSRKYTMLGRLVTRWRDIVGSEMADKTQPVKIRYFKSKKSKGKPTASLDIACSSSEATALHYQKDLILERLNQIFGDNWINSIRFVPIAANADTLKNKRSAPPKPLTPDEKEHLSTMLKDIEDPELQKKLESLGAAILQEDKEKRI